jgi:glucarate dehydratase
MKLSGLTITPVNVPLEAPIRWPWGVRAETTRVIVQLRTDDGIVGFGETFGADYMPVLLESMKQKLVGENPFDLERILSKFQMIPYFTGYAGRGAICAVEMACWDIMGKATNKPLHQLIGGLYRDKIEFALYVFPRYEKNGIGGEDTPEKLAAYCLKMKNDYGFKVFKLKGGVFSPEFDIKTIKLMRESLGEEAKIRIDPNALWTYETALRTCRSLVSYEPEYIEDPVWGIDSMSRLRKEIHVPFSTNMCVVCFEDIPLGVRSNAVDIILGDPHKWGGILATKKLAAVCETFSLGMSMHSGAELGVSTAAYIHLAASTPQIYLAVDGHYHHLVDDVIKGNRMEYRNGCMEIPDGPGLGVEIDEEKLNRFTKRYAQRGAIVHAGEDPDRPAWIPRRPMW